MENNFFARFSSLCKESGTTPNAVAKRIGVSSGSVTAWKRGTAPRNATVTAIADYFGVTTDYLLGKENKAPANIRRCSLSDEEVKFALFGGDGIITDEMYAEVRNFAAFIKRREEERKRKE